LLHVISGQIVGMLDQVSTASVQNRAKKLVPQAGTTLERSAPLPEGATLDESGRRAIQDETCNALMAADGTPAAAIEKLHAAVTEVMNSQKMRETLAEQGIDVKTSPVPADLQRYLEQSVTRYREIAKR